MEKRTFRVWSEIAFSGVWTGAQSAVQSILAYMILLPDNVHTQ